MGTPYGLALLLHRSGCRVDRVTTWGSLRHTLAVFGISQPAPRVARPPYYVWGVAHRPP
eukprot:NODE_12499_length_278_cov_15.052402_g11586_i0.p4 GENE.NODE_12499_length_278_cov_15.052402_g11586_i0~~NODE_12499_length_278_cov_15.052402_g11586_i0.p4  ORF type:complete len:59 (+),score=11.71 NODE_12499_length_278_cov_15.052402_g11586_i0:28-204(+)